MKRHEERSERTRAIARGLSRIVPMQVIEMIFNAKQLEHLICGTQRIDIELLKRHTDFANGVSPDEPYIKWFFESLEGLSDEEQRRFVRFAYGQDSLPANDDEWKRSRTANMRIMPAQKKGDKENQDELMITAQTCFFDVVVPKYSAQSLMDERVRQCLFLL